MTNALYEIPDPDSCDFMEAYNDSEEYDCSPKLTNEFFSEYEGILINGPKKVLWPSNASFEDHPPGPFGETEGPLRLMVCGLMSAPYRFMGLNGGTNAQVLVVAINQENADTYSGKMPEFDGLPPPDDQNEPEVERSEATLNALVSSNFNLDLVHDLGLPIAKARYTIYATLGEYKSNEITVETDIAK